MRLVLDQVVTSMKVETVLSIETYETVGGCGSCSSSLKRGGLYCHQTHSALGSLSPAYSETTAPGGWSALRSNLVRPQGRPLIGLCTKQRKSDVYSRPKAIGQ